MTSELNLFSKPELPQNIISDPNLNKGISQIPEVNSEDLDTSYYYEVLVPLKLPNPILTYSSNKFLEVGLIVDILVRNKEIKGIIWKILDNTENKVSDYFLQNKIQIQVIRSFTYNNSERSGNTIKIKLSKKTIEFLKLIYLHSFNQLGVILESFLLPYTQLSNKSWSKIQLELEKQTKHQINSSTQTSQELKEHSNQAVTTSFKTTNNLINKEVKNNSQFISFEVNQLVEYIKIRIMVLIRSNINAYLINKNDIIEKKISLNPIVIDLNLLQIIPEKKYLKVIQREFNWKLITQAFEREFNLLEEFKNQNFKINIISNSFNYSEKSSESQTLISKLIFLNLKQDQSCLIKSDKINKKTEQDHKSYETSYNSNISLNVPNVDILINLNIYTGSRSIMFLPFEFVDLIYLFDEGSSYYIQEQNSLYYDTRELIYYFARIYSSSLYLISNHQSTRAYQYQKTLLTSPTLKKKLDTESIETSYNLKTEENIKISYNTASVVIAETIEEKKLEKQYSESLENEFFGDSDYYDNENTQKSLRINLVKRSYFNASITDIFSFEVDQIIKKELGLED